MEVQGEHMNKFRPTLWRTCRVIANSTRLSLLNELFKVGELHVADLARRIGTSDHNATTQLRALNARGLILSRRQKMRVIYRAEANREVDSAIKLLKALNVSFQQSLPKETVIRMATAFTHERRIEIVRALDGSKKTFYELRETTGMSAPSLSRHIRKLETRGFVIRTSERYCLARPENCLGRTLLKLALAR
jgi:DNA-binding HxlR family transcriptional regulator